MTERATAPRDEAIDQRDEAIDRRDLDRDEASGPRGTIAREERLSRHQADRSPDRPSDADAELFDPSTADELQRRWQAVQVRFVDEPRQSVERADELVAEVLDQLTSSFATERRELEAAWSGGRDASTEDLRQAIRRYRTFFNRLLAV